MVYMFMEFCEGGSLAALLEHGRIEDENVLQLYTLQLVRARTSSLSIREHSRLTQAKGVQLDGLCYLHGQNVVHRDIKPDSSRSPFRVWSSITQ